MEPKPACDREPEPTKEGMVKRLSLCFALTLWIAAQDDVLQEFQDFHFGLEGFAQDQSTWVLPLELTDMDLQVTGQILYAKVRQVYVNDTPWPLEVTYTFPLPCDASITGMEFTTAGRTIRSVVQERQEAQQTYTAAKRQGKKTALLEQDRPNLFTTSLANILPGERIDIRFQYLVQLPFRQDHYELTVPTTFGPRFVPLEEDDAADSTASADVSKTSSNPPKLQDLDRLIPPVIERELAHGFTFTAHFTGLPIANITSNTHLLDVVEVQEGAFDVALTESQACPDRDVHLDIELWDAETPTIGLVVSHGALGTHGLLTVFPPLDGHFVQNPLEKQVVFLIDTSGSMSGLSIDQAKAGLIECMSYLDPNDQFNIIRFSDDHSCFSPGFVPADDRHLRAAEHYVNGLTANGGTRMAPALAFALDMPHQPDTLRMIFFLTDGDVGNEDTMFSLLADGGGDARLFCFGVGSAPNAFLVNKLSQTGRGLANFIRDEQDIARVMADFFATISAPVLTDVQVTWFDRNDRPLDALLQTPRNVPDVFLGRPLQVLCLFDDLFDGSVEVRGKMNGQLRSFHFDASQLVLSEHPGVEKIFGQTLNGELIAQRLREGDPQVRETLKQVIVDTALQYQLVTPFTSRVAVEQRIEKNQFGELVTVQVPVAEKFGSASPGFSATATTDPLFLALGTVLLALTGLLAWRRHAMSPALR